MNVFSTDTMATAQFDGLNFSTTETPDKIQTFYDFRQPFEGTLCIPWYLAFPPFITSTIIILLLRRYLHNYCPEFFDKKPHPFHSRQPSKRVQIHLNWFHNEEVKKCIRQLLSTNHSFPSPIIENIISFVPFPTLDPRRNLNWTPLYGANKLKSVRSSSVKV